MSTSQNEMIYDPTATPLMFYDVLAKRAPPTTEVLTRIPLLDIHERANIVLLHRILPPRDDEALSLRALWPLLGKVALVEFNDPVTGFRPADLLTLLDYGLEYNRIEMNKLIEQSSDLTLVLVTPAETPSLRSAVDHMETWRLRRLESQGYARIEGASYDIIVVFIDEVCKAEQDDYMLMFSRHREKPTDLEAIRWFNKHYFRMTGARNIRELEGFDELTQRVLGTIPPEKRIEGLTLEQRLHGLMPEQLAARLTPEQRLIGMTPEQKAVLRKLLDESK